MTGRFEKGRSGNPAGRPKARRPHVSAFDIIFDRKLTVTQNGVERELTIDEALQLQTYQAALKGSKIAIRSVLKMIEKRELALAAVAPKPAKQKPVQPRILYDSNSADEAMKILRIGGYDEACTEDGWWKGKLKIATWAAQAAISRPGRRSLDHRTIAGMERSIVDFAQLRWPRGASR